MNNTVKAVQDKVYRTILDHHLFESGDSIGIGVSGGKDSMVLLDVLLEIRERLPDINISVLHFEHGIRGDESKNDMEFVRSYVEGRNIPFFSNSGDSLGFAKENSLNLEESARTLRYAFFEDTMKKNGISRIAVAHHKNDNVETFLFNLTRGAGSLGLDHMDYSSGYLIRPLLDVSRTEIEEYIRLREIPYREDSTNNDLSYSRNFIRRQLIPDFEHINPNAVAEIDKATAILSEEHEFLNAYFRDLFETTAEATEDEVRFRISEIGRYSDLEIKRLVMNAIYHIDRDLKDLTEQHISKILEFVRNGKTNRSYDLPGGIRAYTSYDLLIITGKMYKINKVQPVCVKGCTTQVYEHCFKIEVSEIPDKFPDKGSFEQYIDGGKLPDDLVIRQRMDGDYFYPFSLKGKQKLKKWFIDSKIPVAERDEQLLLCHGSEVLWIIGKALSDRLRIDDNTTTVRKISFF